MENLQWSGEIGTPAVQECSSEPHASAWHGHLPTLRGKQVVLRELRASDAPSLFALLTTSEVRRFIYEPPVSVEGFERFISWTRRHGADGRSVSFAVTLAGFDTAIGVFQVRAHESNFSLADWGFAIGSPFWGTGVFRESAELVLQFIFDTLRVRRLEATAALRNGRANRALLKVGAVQEGVLRRSFFCGGEYLDEALYSILADDYRASHQYAGLLDQLVVH